LVTTALYPGSFDPLHLGHLAVVEQAARSFDHVVVAVLGNPQKRSGMFPIPERIRLAEAATAHLSNVRCVGHHGLTVDVARAEHADVLVRSAHKDAAQEWSMAAMNETMSGIPTFFATPDSTTRAISASLVRLLVTSGKYEAARQLVPDAVRRAIEERLPDE
jgi:pantetheine-phosphate adenylyltransferase